MKISLISLGCSKNLVDSEIVLGAIEKEKHISTDDLNIAEVIIVNTCAFINDAKKESIDTILDLAKYKKGKCKVLVVIGCLAQRYKDEIIKSIPEVDLVFGTGSFDSFENILVEIEDYLNKKNEKFSNAINCDLPSTVDYLNRTRVISTLPVFAYLKIAEGCNNHCTYCVIPSLKGQYKSRKIEDILDEAKHIAEMGAGEIVLIAQDTTSYGIDIYKRQSLCQLLREITSIEGDFKVRIMYCYPELITEELIDEIGNNPKIIKYIDLPIQHISDKMLTAMGRKGRSSQIKKLLTNLREQIPGIIIRTTFIVGFPGETKEDFDELAGFVRDFKFDRMGVFKYSREDDTPASSLANQVHHKTKELRYSNLMNIQSKIFEERNRESIGSVINVTNEGIDDDGIFYYGRSYAEAPDNIDRKIYFVSDEPLEIARKVNVVVLDYNGYDLVGKVKKDEFA
jgi:ribosomal protein S12 methylthiotransferase